MDLQLERITRQSEARLRAARLNDLVAEPHVKKVQRSKAVVSEFEEVLGKETVYVSTSGGKDSAALSNLCKAVDPEIRHVMFDTGLEYKDTIELAKSQGATIIPPRTGWKVFCEAKGYPAVSKHVSKRIHDAKISPIGCALTLFSGPYHLADKWLHFLEMPLLISHKCCDEFKKKPAKQLHLNPIIGTRISESADRKSAWKKTGCNSYNLAGTKGVSRPLSLWKDEDVDRYVHENGVPLSKIYTQYEAKRTGCVCCPYGAHLEESSRFDLLHELEPKRYEHFMKTPLRQILLASGVQIKTDPAYMKDLEQVQADLARWHEEAAGDDRYFSWKCRWAVKHYGKQAMIEAVRHIYKDGRGVLIRPLEEIEKGIEAYERR